MIQWAVSQIDELARAARDNYGVNPVVFLIIYLGCVPVFYYSLFRTLRAVKQKIGKQIMFWSAVFLFTNIAPFLYVLAFGRNIPWWVYGIMAILIGQAIFSLITKLRKNPADPADMSAD